MTDRGQGRQIDETPLPGVGVRYEFTTQTGERVGVVHYRSGKRELAVYEAEDPDCVRVAVSLDENDARTLAEILGASRVAEHLARLRQSVQGLSIDWLPVPAGAVSEGRTIGDTRARTRSGASIVAVLRGADAIPAPGPEQELRAGDTLVVVGTDEGIRRLNEILRAG